MAKWNRPLTNLNTRECRLAVQRTLCARESKYQLIEIYIIIWHERIGIDIEPEIGTAVDQQNKSCPLSSPDPF